MSHTWIWHDLDMKCTWAWHKVIPFFYLLKLILKNYKKLNSQSRADVYLGPCQLCTGMTWAVPGPYPVNTQHIQWLYILLISAIFFIKFLLINKFNINFLMKSYKLLMILIENHRLFRYLAKWMKTPKIGQNSISRKQATEDIFAKVLFIIN